MVNIIQYLVLSSDVVIQSGLDEVFSNLKI